MRLQLQLLIVGLTRLGVDKVKPKGWFWGLGDFGFWGLGIDDNVHVEDGGLLQVLPLTVHLNFFDGQVGWTETFLLSKLFCGIPPSWVGGCQPQSPFGFLGLGT